MGGADALLERWALDPRINLRNDRPLGAGSRCVVYWMQRAQRATDNPALDAAVEAANALGKPVAVLVVLMPSFPGAVERHFAFLLDGLPEIARGIERRGGALVVRIERGPRPPAEVVRFAREAGAALVVGDENPLREPERWRKDAASQLPVPFATVDADVVVPTALLPKEEFAARTLRPKIHAALAEHLDRPREPNVRTPFPASRRPESEAVDPQELLRRLAIDRSVAPAPGQRGGTGAGEKALARFIADRLADYPERRNHPEFPDGTSGLSAYLHFGHLGPRSIARAVERSGAPGEARAAYLEQLIVRRELAVNFVVRNPSYDSFEGLHRWARTTLEEHLTDRRPALYPEEVLERGRTADPLWNAAQTEMVLTGRMSGYLRMYWAKKILEWTEHPARAMEIAIRLNDRYELDGRDPNGYAGIAWAIGGKHDRPWPERRVFGKIRFMSLASTSRKFGSRDYIERIAALAGKRGAPVGGTQ